MKKVRSYILQLKSWCQTVDFYFAYGLDDFFDCAVLVHSNYYYRLESVDSEPPAQQKKTDQGTQMSARGSPKDIGTSPLRLCEICSCLPCTCKPVSSVTRKEKGTQMSPQPCQKCQKTVCACSVRSGEKIIEKPCLNCKTTPCACLSSLCSTCGKTSCRCPPPSERSPLPETQACQHCKKTSCGCQIKRSRSSGREKLPSSGRQLKEINGEVFATHLDDDFTSSEVCRFLFLLFGVEVKCEVSFFFF